MAKPPGRFRSLPDILRCESPELAHGCHDSTGPKCVWLLRNTGRATTAPADSRRGRVCRVGPGNFTPSLSQIRT